MPVFGSGAFGTSVYSNTPFYNTSTLIDAVLRASGHSNPSTETAKRALVLNFINNRYSIVAGARPWSWLYSLVDFNLEAPYETGEVLVTNGSASVVGTGTTWTSAYIPNHKFIAASGKNEIYSVEEVGSTTTLELGSEYSSETEDEVSYKLVQDTYELPGDLGEVQSVIVDGQVGKLILIGTQEMAQKQASDPTLTGTPRWATVTTRRPQDGVRHLVVYPIPDEKYQVHLHYSVNMMALEDSTDSYPLIPDKHRAVLFYGALEDMQNFMKNYQGALNSRATFDKAFLAMVNDKQLTDSKLVLRPSTRIGRRSRKMGPRVSISAADFGRLDD
jgi:hypothetical protein